MQRRPRHLSYCPAHSMPEFAPPGWWKTPVMPPASKPQVRVCTVETRYTSTDLSGTSPTPSRQLDNQFVSIDDSRLVKDLLRVFHRVQSCVAVNGINTLPASIGPSEVFYGIAPLLSTIVVTYFTQRQHHLIEGRLLQKDWFEQQQHTNLQQPRPLSQSTATATVTVTATATATDTHD
jgi:hypothetical protein